MQIVTEIQTITILLFFFLNKIFSYFRDIQSLQQGLLCQSYNFILFSIYPHIFNGLFSLEVILDFFCTLRSEQSVQVYRSLFFFFFTLLFADIKQVQEQRSRTTLANGISQTITAILFSVMVVIFQKKKIIEKIFRSRDKNVCVLLPMWVIMRGLESSIC